MVQVSITCTGTVFSVHVCLTIFVSVFSSGADPAPQHLHMLATGAAVKLVDSVMSPTHGVSHLCLVLHVHAEVDSIHAKHLLEHPQTHPEFGGQLTTRLNMQRKAIYNSCHSSLSCMPMLTCNGLHITSNIWIHLEKVETDGFRNTECWKSRA